MNYRLALALLLGLALGHPLMAEDSATALAAKAQVFSSAPQFTVSAQLVILDGTGDRKTRGLSIWILREAKEERFLAQVTAPAFLKNLKYLQVKTKEGTGTWLKTSKGVQRLSDQAEPEPLFGSDFTTADFQPGSADWTWGPSNQDSVVLIRATPPRLGWSRQVLTLRKSDNLILQSDFLSQDDTLVRRYRVVEISANGIPRRVELEDFKNHRSSLLEVQTFDPAAPIAPSLFLPGRL